MGSGCGDLIVEKIPSSSGQLPVPVALNARSPTLFTEHYTGFLRKVNSKYKKVLRDYSTGTQANSRISPVFSFLTMSQEATLMRDWY